MKPTVPDSATVALLRKQAEAGLALVETLDPAEARKAFARARESSVPLCAQVVIDHRIVP